MTGPYHLYALFAKGAHQPFYVGATCNPKAREWAHRKRFKIDLNLVVLETRKDPLEIARLETGLIAQYLRQGVSIQNRALVSSYRGFRRRYSVIVTEQDIAEWEQQRVKKIAEWEANRLKKIARRERQLRLEAEATICRAKFAEMVADGSADRIAREILAANKTRT